MYVINILFYSHLELDRVGNSFTLVSDLFIEESGLVRTSSRNRPYVQVGGGRGLEGIESIESFVGQKNISEEIEGSCVS